MIFPSVILIDISRSLRIYISCFLAGKVNSWLTHPPNTDRPARLRQCKRQGGDLLVRAQSCAPEQFGFGTVALAVLLPCCKWASFVEGAPLLRTEPWSRTSLESSQRAVWRGGLFASPAAVSLWLGELSG